MGGGQCGGIRHGLLLEHDQTSPELGHFLLPILDIDLNASNRVENLPHVGSTWVKGKCRLSRYAFRNLLGIAF